MEIVVEQGVILLNKTNASELSIDIKISSKDCCLFLGENELTNTSILDTIIGFKKVIRGKISLSSVSLIAYCVRDSDSSLLSWLNIEKNILFPATLNNLEKAYKPIANRLLWEFSLEKRIHDYPIKLSSEEKHIVNFIRTICTPSDLWLFDEPFQGMHYSSKEKAKEILNRFIGEKTILIISQPPKESAISYTRFFNVENRIIKEVK